MSVLTLVLVGFFLSRPCFRGLTCENVKSCQKTGCFNEGTCNQVTGVCQVRLQYVKGFCVFTQQKPLLTFFGCSITFMHRRTASEARPAIFASIHFLPILKIPIFATSPEKSGRMCTVCPGQNVASVPTSRLAMP